MLKNNELLKYFDEELIHKYDGILKIKKAGKKNNG